MTLRPTARRSSTARRRGLRARRGAASLDYILLLGVVALAAAFVMWAGPQILRLIAMIGAAMERQRSLEALLWTFVLGGCVGLIALVWRMGPARLAAMVTRQLLWLLRLGEWSPWTSEERAALRPPLFLAPNALAAVAIVEFGVVEWIDRWLSSGSM